MTKHNDDRRIHTITDAPEAHTDEMRGRIVRYSISMSIRLVCLILMFVVHGWLQWVCFAGAVFLPYIAVILANAGADRNRVEGDIEFMAEQPTPQLTAAPDDEASPGVVHGEVVEPDDDEPGPANDGGSRPGDQGPASGHTETKE